MIQLIEDRVLTILTYITAICSLSRALGGCAADENFVRKTGQYQLHHSVLNTYRCQSRPTLPVARESKQVYICEVVQ